jgi:hypothetical protein
MNHATFDATPWTGVISELVATRAPELEVGVANADPEVLLRLVRVVSALNDDASRSLRDSVSAARNAGVSWDAIGTVLGTSRQAAQQRFADPRTNSASSANSAGADSPDSEKRVLLGVNLFNEMEALQREGRDGWILVAALAGSLEFERSNTALEYRRARSLRKQMTIDDLATDGWRYCCSYSVLHYFSRPVPQ